MGDKAPEIPANYTMPRGSLARVKLSWLSDMISAAACSSWGANLFLDMHCNVLRLPLVQSLKHSLRVTNSLNSKLGHRFCR